MRDSAPKGYFNNLKDGFSVGDFDITGDTKTALKCGIQVALLEHSSFTHYRVREKANGSNELHFLWAGTGDKDAVALPFTLRDPDAISMFICSWLQENGSFDTDACWGGDGTDSYGFRLTNSQQDIEAYNEKSNYLALRVCPTFVYYSK